jgi:hypothetical protein
MRGQRGGLHTSIPMHKARAMAHGFLDRVGGPFNETRDGSGSEDCNRYKRPAMAERRSTSGELPGRGWHMARVSQGVYLPQLEQAASFFYRMQERNPIQDTGELWTAALIGFTHKADGNRGSAHEKLEAESRTRALYEQASQLIVENREMFARMPLDDRLQQPMKSLLAWVAHVTPSVKMGLQEAQARICDKILDIREFFKPTILLQAVRGLNGAPAAHHIR